jgi:hypothetical protein
LCTAGPRLPYVLALGGTISSVYSRTLKVAYIKQYHLFHTIRSELDDLHAAKGKRGFVRVAFSGGKRPPCDLTDADGICEWLDERGFIDQELHKIKTMMESAHNLEAYAKKGEED